MKILIGTPIHQIKDYAMEHWIKNVATLTSQLPADLLLVDNSPDLSYIKQVKKYLKKYDIKNYKIKHINFDQGMSIDEKDKRIEVSQEVIRQEILSSDYDAWFSWECDQIIPSEALGQLVKVMESGGFMMVVHNSWARNDHNEFNPDMGITLIRRDCLEKYEILRKKDFDHWKGGEAWFKERVLRAGGNYTDVYGLITPIYHLDK
jgi:hypothetical protein